MEENFLKKMAGQPPLTAELLVNKIYGILEENIVNMTLPPGSNLAEENIARILGVSRSPVREALMRLENSGLVVRKAGKGRVVTSFTEQEVVDNYEIWEMIEGFAGGLACLSARDRDYEGIEATLIQMKASTVTEDDFYRYRQLNYQFHSQLVRPCPNKALVRMYENALKPIVWCWNLSMLWQRTISNSHAEHEAIFFRVQAAGQGFIRETGSQTYPGRLRALPQRVFKEEKSGCRRLSGEPWDPHQGESLSGLWRRQAFFHQDRRETTHVQSIPAARTDQNPRFHFDAPEVPEEKP